MVTSASLASRSDPVTDSDETGTFFYLSLLPYLGAGLEVVVILELRLASKGAVQFVMLVHGLGVFDVFVEVEGVFLVHFRGERGVAREIVWAWVLTIPAAAPFAALSFFIIRLISVIVSKVG